MKHILKHIKLTLAVAVALFSLSAPVVFAQGTGSDTSSGASTGTGPGSGGSAVTGLDAKQHVCDGLDATGTSGCGQGTGMDVPGIIRAVINILSVVVGAVSVIMIIIGGFRYVVSNGDSNAVSGAKNTILYALVGLVVVLFAQVIVAFVIDRATTPPAAPASSTTP